MNIFYYILLLLCFLGAVNWVNSVFKYFYGFVKILARIWPDFSNFYTLLHSESVLTIWSYFRQKSLEFWPDDLKLIRTNIFMDAILGHVLVLVETLPPPPPWVEEVVGSYQFILETQINICQAKARWIYSELVQIR